MSVSIFIFFGVKVLGGNVVRKLLLFDTLYSASSQNVNRDLTL